MLPKDRFITTSSKSATSNSHSSGLDTPIQFVKGVGPKLGAVFNSREINTVKDLLFFFPRTYEDRTRVGKVKDLRDSESATLNLRVVTSRLIPVPRLGRSILEVRCADDSGGVNLKWFYPPRGMEKRFYPGAVLTATGKVKIYQGKPEIIHPEITWDSNISDNLEMSEDVHHHNVGRIVPVYTELEGIPSRTFRKVLWQALDKFGDALAEDLPEYLLNRRKFPSLAEAVRSLHFPPDLDDFSKLSDFSTPAHQRLIYSEFFKFEYLMLRNKLQTARVSSASFKGELEKCEELVQALPFRLTEGQKRALEDIGTDLEKTSPMNRLIQGDVGAGKTVIAFLSAARVLMGGGQVALLAPTEILAEQHYKNASDLFKGKLAAALWTGRTSQLDRNTIQSRMNSGEPLLLIGTHAILEENVAIPRLNYVMIDEQHRFGVEQRRTLKQKGTRVDAKTGGIVVPHSLLLTATPIPRTLALTAFGDLDVTSIRDLPPGRSPICTQIVRTAPQRKACYDRIREELKAGRQAYFIYPLVHESEAEGFTELKSAVNEAELLAQEIFPDFTVGLLHGQLDPETKAKVMGEFKAGALQILVSTTVIEVGVDVPNATVMAIEHSERFGLSQLHQLRGRVGRGKFQSHCYLLTHPKKSVGDFPSRLEVLEETNDGFKIAEADLQFRGPGEFLGVRQAGGLPFKLANLVRDRDLLLQARDDAMEVLKGDANLEKELHVNFKRYFEREGSLQFARLNTS